MHTSLLAFIVLLGSFSCLAAPQPSSLAPAQQALAAGQYQTAYRLYQRHAASNPLAQFNLGLFEQHGWQRPANPVAACNWFARAAAGQVPAAQQFYGDCLAQGIGRNADAAAAVIWYQKAADAGISHALCSAGALYIKGQQLPRDSAHGLSLCEAAARAGSVPAMLQLASYYRSGTDIPQDLPAARQWYQQAAALHNHEAQYQLGLMLSEGLGGPVNTAEALFWLEQAASEGYAAAYLPVAILYANAQPNPQTGALSAEHLAKVYLWNSAAKARTREPAQQAEIARIETLTLAVMPAEWQPELDRRVAEHLGKYPLP